MVGQETSININQTKDNWVGVVLDVIGIAIIAIAVFFGGIWFLIRILGRFWPYWFSGLLGALIVLGFDFVFYIAMRWWRPENYQLKALKKLIFVIIFSFSASILACLYIGYITKDMW